MQGNVRDWTAGRNILAITMVRACVGARGGASPDQSRPAQTRPEAPLSKGEGEGEEEVGEEKEIMEEEDLKL